MADLGMSLRLHEEPPESLFVTKDFGLSRRIPKFFKVMDRRVKLLITGENGTGKNLLATEGAARLGRKLFTINIGELPEPLIESELFGTKRGAFTDARDRPGLITQGNGGILLLDEIGEMPKHVQVKLLSVIETNKVRPVGDQEGQELDVQWCFATNRDLPQMVKEGSFREDLYFRLAGWTMFIPPLRERPEDIPLIAARFFGRQGLLLENRMTPEAIEKLQTGCQWPGNVRQLENVLETAHLLTDEWKKIQPEDLGLEHQPGHPDSSANFWDVDEQRLEKLLAGKTLAEVRLLAIKAAYIRHHRNKGLAAKELGIAWKTLHMGLKELGLD